MSQSEKAMIYYEFGLLNSRLHKYRHAIHFMTQCIQLSTQTQHREAATSSDVVAPRAVLAGPQRGRAAFLEGALVETSIGRAMAHL